MADDLRAALRSQLLWRFAFASDDLREARCLVPDAAEPARVAEWVARRVPGRRRPAPPSSSRRRLSPLPTIPAGLEALLDVELRGISSVKREEEAERQGEAEEVRLCGC